MIAMLLVISCPTKKNGSCTMSYPTQSTRWILATLALATLLPSLGSSIANIALPTLAASFATTFDAVQWVVLAYLIAMTVAMVFAGRLGDRVGRRRLFVVGLAMLTAASLVGSVAPSLGLVIAARAVQGIGAAVVVALALAFIGDTVPRDGTGRAMGLLGTMSARGTALGPSLGGLLVEAFGWRSIFLVNVPLGLIALALARGFLPVDRSSARGTSELIDHVRALLAPFRDRRLRVNLGANVLVSVVLTATLVVGPFYLSHGLGLDPAAVGGVMSIGPIAAALLGVPAGRLVDRIGARRMILVGLAGIAVGAAFLALLPEALGVPGYVLPLVVITASYAVFQAANNVAVMGEVARERRGVVSGALNLSRNIGLIGGTSLMGVVFVAAGVHVTFALGGGLMVIALLVVLANDWRAGGACLRSPRS